MIEQALKTWMTWCRLEQMKTKLLFLGYPKSWSAEYRRGRVDGLRAAESTLGLLMFGKGVDLRMQRNLQN